MRAGEERVEVRGRETEALTTESHEYESVAVGGRLTQSPSESCYAERADWSAPRAPHTRLPAPTSLY
jgi:hypothetical protein